MTRGLLLVAHGSHDPRAGVVAERVATAVASEVHGLVAVAAFIELASPSPEEALDRLQERGVDDLTVLPFLLSHAYHSKVDLPEVTELARSRGCAVRAGAVLGPDDLLVGAVAQALDRATTGEPYDAAVLAAAGSSDPLANATVQKVADRLGDRTGVPVVTGFASAASPTVGDAVAVARGLASGSGRVAVATYLLAPGFFAEQIRSDGLAAGAVAVTEPLGACEQVVRVVAQRFVHARVT